MLARLEVRQDTVRKSKGRADKPIHAMIRYRESFGNTMADLAFVVFTEDNDEIVSPERWSFSEGWSLAVGLTKDALSGNDTIAGGLVNNGTILTSNGMDIIQAPGYRSIVNYATGTINTGTDDDIISITRTDSSETLKNYGTIDLGDGDDSITIFGGIQNFHSGVILTGGGNDVITDNGSGMSFENAGRVDMGIGIDSISCNLYLYNSGTIQMGVGNDSINMTTPGYRQAASLLNSGNILTSSGDDRIIVTNTHVGALPLFPSTGISNSGTIHTGIGDDRLTGKGGNYGVVNYGTINTAGDNDVITGIGLTKGIENNGSILTGDGNDSVNALQGGFSGLGTTNLGSGNDVLRGFGTGTFLGGPGSDILVFNPGTYTITAGAPGIYRVSNLGIQMTLSGFERFGAGANVPLFAQAVLAGQVTFT
jgi:hypothetical protein